MPSRTLNLYRKKRNIISLRSLGFILNQKYRDVLRMSTSLTVTFWKNVSAYTQMENWSVKVVACKRTVLNFSACRFVQTLKTYHGDKLAYFQPLILSQKKNIEFGLIDMCSLLTFFIAMLGKFFINVISNAFFPVWVFLLLWQ